MNTTAPASVSTPNRTLAALVGAGLVILTLTAALAWQVGRHSAGADTPAAQALSLPGPIASVPASMAEPLTPPPAPEPARVAQAAPAPAVAPAATPSAHKSPPVRVASPTRVTTAPAPAPETAPQQTDTQGNVTFEPAPTRVPAWSCASCGVVESVTPIKRDGDAQGVGAVAGGVLGGLIGSQMGGGNGKRAATVIGAIGGGIAGHQVEKSMRAETAYEIRVRMDDGSWRSVQQREPASVGARVSVEGGTLRPAPVQDGIRG